MSDIGAEAFERGDVVTLPLDVGREILKIANTIGASLEVFVMVKSLDQPSTTVGFDMIIITDISNTRFITKDLKSYSNVYISLRYIRLLLERFESTYKGLVPEKIFEFQYNSAMKKPAFDKFGCGREIFRNRYCKEGALCDACSMIISLREEINKLSTPEVSDSEEPNNLLTPEETVIVHNAEVDRLKRLLRQAGMTMVQAIAHIDHSSESVNKDKTVLKLINIGTKALSI